MHTVEKGRIAEAKVTAVLVNQGVEVFLPVFGNGTCDLIAIAGRQIVRVEVKYTASKPHASYEVTLRRIRHNRSTIVYKHFDASNSDILAVYVAPLDRVAFLSSRSLHGRNTLSLREASVSNYASFEKALEGMLAVQHSALNPETG